MPTKDKEEELFEKIKYQSNNMTHVIQHIIEYCQPEDIFPTSELDKWAESEGYIKGEHQND